MHDCNASKYSLQTYWLLLFYAYYKEKDHNMLKRQQVLISLTCASENVHLEGM